MCESLHIISERASLGGLVMFSLSVVNSIKRGFASLAFEDREWEWAPRWELKFDSFSAQRRSGKW